jgi:hypothetical protein
MGTLLMIAQHVASRRNVPFRDRTPHIVVERPLDATEQRHDRDDQE